MGIILIDDVFSSQTSLKETEVNLLNQLTTIEKNKNALELLVSTSIPNDLLPTGFKDTGNSLMLSTIWTFIRSSFLSLYY